MTYVFITETQYPMPLAKHLQMEGNDVLVGLIKERKDLRLGLKDTEEPKERQQRMTLYQNMLDVKTYAEVMNHLKGVKNKDDYFIFFDYNDLCMISEDILKLGFRNGLLPTMLYYKLEKERDLGKEMVKKFYPNLIVADSFKFKKVADGIKHIEGSKDEYVLKSMGNAGKTVVPKTDDIEIAKRLLIDTLNKYAKEYEQGGFTLEKKIPHALEVTPVLVFWNGKPVYSLAEFECKEFGAGNIGVQKGGNLAVSIRTDLNCELNKIAFPEVVYKMAKNHPGMAIYDAGLLYADGKFYFTEYCGMRFGYDGIYSEIVMRDDGKPFVTNYFQDVMAGRNPLKNKFGVSVRLFNIEGNSEETSEPKEDLPLIWEKPIDKNLFLYRVKKIKDSKGEPLIASVGMCDLLGCVTGAGDSLESAANVCYKRIDSIDFEKLYYRPKFDMLSTDYESSIVNRIKAINKFI